MSSLNKNPTNEAKNDYICSIRHVNVFDAIIINTIDLIRQCYTVNENQFKLYTLK